MATYAYADSYAARPSWSYPLAEDDYYYTPRSQQGSSRSIYIDPQQLDLMMASPHSPSFPDYPYLATAETSSPTYESLYLHEQSAGSQRRRTAPASFPNQEQRSYTVERNSAHRASRISSATTPMFYSNLPTPPLSPSSTILSSASSAYQLATPRSLPNHHCDAFTPSLALTQPPTPSATSQRHFCTHPVCLDSETGKPTKSFSRRADLQRHNTCHHEDAPLFSCPRPNCSRKGAQGFTRQDHLMEHRRGYHHEDLPKRASRSGEAKKSKPASASRRVSAVGSLSRPTRI